MSDMKVEVIIKRYNMYVTTFWNEREKMSGN